MKKIITIGWTTFLEWLLRPQTFIFVPVLIFYYIVIIEPMCFCAEVFQTPIGLFEPYIALVNSGQLTPVLPLLFLFLMAGYPKVSAAQVFQLHRSGKVTWFWGQVFFLFLVAFTTLLSFFLFSILCVQRQAFVANGWSLAARQIQYPENLKFRVNLGSAVIDESVLNQIRPYRAVGYGTLLQLGNMLIAAFIDFYATIHGKKLFGVFVNCLQMSFSLLLMTSKLPIRWLFVPVHSVFAWHYHATLNLTTFPIWGSFLYMGIWLLGMLLLSLRGVKRCSIFSIMQFE